MGHSLIVGYGEVGKALAEVLRSRHQISVLDFWSPPGVIANVDVMHVCFPYSDRFSAFVKRYQVVYQPSQIVIHSTVPVGTSGKLGAFHSPVRGNHPRLAEAMRTFVTYLAPHDDGLCAYFQSAGMKIEQVREPEETEAGKLWELAAFAWSITLEKTIHAYCQERGLDFDVVYRQFSETYNRGFQDMGMPHVTKPVLKHMPGPIGGHCILPGCDLLGDSLTSVLLEGSKVPV